MIVHVIVYKHHRPKSLFAPDSRLMFRRLLHPRLTRFHPSGPSQQVLLQPWPGFLSVHRDRTGPTSIRTGSRSWSVEIGRRRQWRRLTYIQIVWFWLEKRAFHARSLQLIDHHGSCVRFRKQHSPPHLRGWVSMFQDVPSMMFSLWIPKHPSPSVIHPPKPGAPSTGRSPPRVGRTPAELR